MANLPGSKTTYGSSYRPPSSMPYGNPAWQRPPSASTQIPPTSTGNSNDWILPVVGMSNKKGKFNGGSPQWSGGFGYQKPASKGGHTHKGIDIYANRGDAIVSPVRGTIKSVGGGGKGGNYVKVKGDDGYEYYFAHMEYSSSGLAAGQQVNAGAFLGGVGNSGNASGTGTHLHFEVRKNGTAIDPTSFLTTGKIQNNVPMSSIPGLNSIEQVQAFIDEQVAASYNMMQAENAGFDPAVWGGGAEASEDDIARTQVQKGQSFLGSTLDSMSNALSGGGRTPMQKMSSANQAIEGGDAVPTAAEQRQIVEES